MAIEDFVSQVQDSGKVAEERVYSLVQDCLDKCQRMTESSLKGLLCDEIDLKRQLHMSDWLDGFMRQQMLELSRCGMGCWWCVLCGGLSECVPDVGVISW